jgi:tetratricopeptide (TPR) repeat protein
MTAFAPPLLLVAITCVAYLPVFRAGFIWDDDSYVTQNQTLRSTNGLRRIWLEPGAVPQYYPLVHTTFWVEYHLWDLTPAGFHAVNILLHAGNSILLWLILRRLELRWAWLIAAIFALHPVQVESVAWVTERKNVLSGLFYLLALSAYVRFRPLIVRGQTPLPPGEGAGGGSKSRTKNPLPALPLRAGGAGPRLFYVLALLAFVAALLCKTVTCSLPAAILLLTWWKRGRLRWSDVRPLLPLFVLGLGLSLVTVRMESRMVAATGAEWNLSLVERLLLAGRAPWFYAGKLLYPASLAFIYPRWTIDEGAAWQYLFPLATAMLIAGLWWTRRRIGRGPLVAVLLFGGTLFPALGLIDVYPMRYSFVADHFQYLASVGLIALVVSVAAAVVQRAHAQGPRAVWAMGAVCLAVLGVLTWQQTLVYRNLETLWRDVLVKNPTAFIALNNLGIYLDEQGRTAEAIAYFERGLAVRPDSLDIRNNLANAYGKTRRFADAVRMYAAILEQQPNSAITHYNLGITYAQLQRYDQARLYLTRALELSPLSLPFRDALVRVLLRQAEILVRAGRTAEAIACYQECLRVQPDNPQARAALARLQVP